MADLTRLNISEALRRMQSGEISALDLCQAHLQQIDRHDSAIRAFIKVTPEIALEQARAADNARANGDERPLLGIPIALKDVLSTQGIETTCGSRILQGYVPLFDATAVARLKEAGAVQ